MSQAFPWMLYFLFVSFLDFSICGEITNKDSGQIERKAVKIQQFKFPALGPNTLPFIIEKLLNKRKQISLMGELASKANDEDKCSMFFTTEMEIIVSAFGEKAIPYLVGRFCKFNNDTIYDKGCLVALGYTIGYCAPRAETSFSLKNLKQAREKMKSLVSNLAFWQANPPKVTCISLQYIASEMEIPFDWLNTVFTFFLPCPDNASEL